MILRLLHRIVRLTVILGLGLALPAGRGAVVLSDGPFTPAADFRSFTRHHSKGLPQSTVAQILQDEQGTLWLGTMDGLARFSGTDMQEVIPPAPLPPFGGIYALIQRTKGGFYVGCASGLYLFDHQTWQLLRGDTQVISLAEQSDGRLWMIDQNGTVWISHETPEHSPSWDQMTLPQAGAANQIVAVGTSVWIASHTALIRMNHERIETVLSVPQAWGVISAMSVQSEGTCWIGTQKGRLLHVMRGGEALIPLDPEFPLAETITALTEDRLGRIWAGTRGGHVAFAAPGKPWEVWDESTGLNGMLGVMSLLADREGSIWIGHNANGLQQLLSESWRHRPLWLSEGRSQSAGAVFGISAGCDGDILAAVFSHGLWKWNGRSLQQFGAAEGLSENVRCAAEPEPGVLWVGHRHGLSESREGGPFKPVLTLAKGFIIGFFQSPEGKWYAASTADGLFTRTDSGWRPAAEFNPELTDPYACSIVWRKNGEIWVACSRGLTIFHQGHATRHVAANTPGLPLTINCILEVSPSEMWIGGLGGIMSARDGAAWQPLADADGLPGRTIYSLAKAPDGSVWAGGSQGVSRYSGGRWTTYDSANGLLDEETNLGGLLVTPDNSVYVGTMGGLARYREVPAPPTAPLRCFWVTPALLVSPQPQLHLPLGQRSLTVAWSAPWLKPNEIEYRTRIRSRSEAWSQPSDRTELALENLGPGKWTVEVQARFAGGGDAGWTEPLLAEVEIPPLFRETITAQILVLLGLGAVIALLLRWWSWRLDRNQARLQAAMQEAQSSVRTLRGMIPICSGCKNIRDDQGAWKQMEAYVRANSEAEFSHGICPDCARRLYPDYPLGRD